MLFLDNDAAAAVITMPDIVAALTDAYRDLATGDGICRPRIDLRLPIDDERAYQWGTMEGGSARTGYLAIRMKSDVLTESGPPGARTQEKYCVEPGRFCGLVMLIDIRTGEPVAMLNDGLLQHLRVGADSAVGTDLAARHDARVLGIFGSGGMARSHVEALLTVRPLERVQVYSPTRAHREQFAAEIRRRHSLEAVALDRPEAVYAGADIIAACTDAAGEVVRGRHLRPGTHVTCIGGRLDPQARRRIDRWLRLGDATACESPLTWTIQDEYVVYRARPDAPLWRHHLHGRNPSRPPADARVVRMEDVLAHRTSARENPHQVTFSERGNIQGAQFHAVAALVYERARERGLGHTIPRAWLLQDIRD